VDVVLPASSTASLNRVTVWFVECLVQAYVYLQTSLLGGDRNRIEYGAQVKLSCGGMGLEVIRLPDATWVVLEKEAFE